MIIYVPGSVVMGAAVVRRGVGGSVLTSVAYCPKNLIVYVSTFTNTLKYLSEKVFEQNLMIIFM